MDRADPLTAKGVPCAFREYEAFRDGAWHRVEKATDRISFQPAP